MRRSTGSHTVDVRFRFLLLFRSYYLVFLLGSERRSSPCGVVPVLARALSRGLEGVVIAITLGLVVIIAAYALYVVKWTLGIDIFPDWGPHVTPPWLWRELTGG